MPVGLWVMRTADGDLVDVLPAGAAGADERDEVEVALGDLDFAVGLVELRHDVDARRSSSAACPAR